MNANFEKAVNFVRNIERSETYEENPNDPGGGTKFGISQRSYPKLDIKNLTWDEAKAIYKTDFWQACRCDELPDGFDIVVMDAAFNQGTGPARRMLQTSLGVIADGIIGDNTIAALHKAGKHELKLLITHRCDLYRKSKNIDIFAIDWYFRIVSLCEFIFGTQPGMV